MSGALGRRRFLGLAGGAGVVLATGLGVPRLLTPPTSTGAAALSAGPLPEPFRRPLSVPRVLAPVARTAGADHYEIAARPALADLVPGRPTPIWGYEGTFPGPTLETRRGRTVDVRHRNELPVPTVVHLHGGHTPPESDGFPTDLVLPAGRRWDAGHATMHDLAARVTQGEREHVYPQQQRAATLWYHDHRMDFTGPAVYRGLAGFHLVRDDEEDALPLPRGERELPLMITDRTFAADGSFVYPSVDPTLSTTPGVAEPFTAGMLGDVVLVNGVPWPEHEVSATRHRLRLLNASNARRYDLVLDPPAPFVQIGADQGLLEAPVAHESIETAPAERHDVVVDFGRYPVGAEVVLRNRLDAGPAGLVMRFRVARRAVEDSVVPARLSAPDRLERSAATVTRDFRFATGHVGDRRGWVIGGQPFAAGRADARPRLDDVEIWRFVTDLHHPVHLHLADFRVISRSGRVPRPIDAGPKDTVDLRPGETAEVITRFTGYRGRYVFHCHNAEHEDMGMMAVFETV